MTFLNTLLIRKLTLFLGAAMLSMSVMASDYIEDLANQGHASAQVSLGTKYYYGLNAPQDYVKAFEWYKKSADQGMYLAQHSLGMMYYHGKGVRQNTATAKEWFGKACDNGFQKGCNNYRMLNQ